MHQPQPTDHPSREKFRKARAEAIEKFLDEFAPCDNRDLLFQMIVTICRLAADNAERGDLKILNSALAELRYAFKVFAPYTEIPKVSIFGSARTPEDHPQYLEAKRFGELIMKEGWMVITGAGGGIMQAGHHGASREASFGVAISLPFEQETNSYIDEDPKLVQFKYFFTRKLMFVKEARAIVLFPGGLGTQDEGFEALTLVQTGKAVPVPIVLCDEPGGTYWLQWQAYVKAELLVNKMIDPEDLKLFRVTDDAQVAVDEILCFYKTYHSARYVEDLLVIRLNKALPDDVMQEISERFASILVRGKFEQHGGPVDGENGEFPDLPRLTFCFDRRSAGKLRMLIDRINKIS